MAEPVLTREELETICSEEGCPVAPCEWDMGLENGLRQAFDQYQRRVAEMEIALEILADPAAWWGNGIPVKATNIALAALHLKPREG